MPGAPALAPDKLESVKTFGGCVSKGSIGNKFVAKYILLIGHSNERGLNSVVIDWKFLGVLPINDVERLAILFFIFII